MKFAHEFERALAKEGFPDHWIKSAVQYGQLKKCIKRIQLELDELGLDRATLAQLVRADAATHEPAGQPAASPDDRRVSFQYEFAHGSDGYRPKLTVFVHIKDGVPVDATLSSETREYLTTLARESRGEIVGAADGEQGTGLTEDPGSEEDSPQEKVDGASDARKLEIPLAFDDEFFGLLQGEVDALERLQDDEKQHLSAEIVELSRIITEVTKPSRFNNRDLKNWRALFELYLEAGVFFSTQERNRGKRNSTTAMKQLKWFQEQVDQRGLLSSFKLPQSKVALKRFVAINLSILQHLKFQEINQKAVTKILKKFDKRTSLGAKHVFPGLLRSRKAVSEDLAKAVCAEISKQLVSAVPQVEEYSCPICCSIAWKPVRLGCGHLFCIRCMIVMQREEQEDCPLCRGKVVLKADAGNLDKDLMRFMKKWFPFEIKQKQRENEIEAGVDVFGEAYRDTKACTIM